MAFNLNGIDRDGIVRVAAGGNLTWKEVQGDGKPGLSGILGANWAQHRILLDMGDAHFIDSAAVGWLMESVKTVSQNGGKLVLLNVQPQVQQVFDLLRVGRVIPVAREEAEARQLLQDQPG